VDLSAIVTPPIRRTFYGEVCLFSPLFTKCVVEFGGIGILRSASGWGLFSRFRSFFTFELTRRAATYSTTTLKRQGGENQQYG
jgi:hypothetical protein